MVLIRNKIKFKIPNYSMKKLVITSLISLGIVNSSNVISQPLPNSSLNINREFPRTSFITQAVEKTGLQ